MKDKDIPDNEFCFKNSRSQVGLQKTPKLFTKLYALTANKTQKLKKSKVKWTRVAVQIYSKNESSCSSFNLQRISFLALSFERVNQGVHSPANKK